MKAEARLSSHHDAGKLATMVEVAYSPAGDRGAPVEQNVEEVEYAAFEIGSALTLTRRAAERELDLALSLTGKLRQVREKFRRGLIDIRRVKVFDSQLGHLSSDTIEAVSEKVLDRAEGLTTGQLQARLAREVMETDPEGADVGYYEGLADRRMTTYANPDGTANQGVHSIAPDARRRGVSQGQSVGTGAQTRLGATNNRPAPGRRLRRPVIGPRQEPRRRSWCCPSPC